MLRIADLEFVVASCQLEAYCSAERMKWDVELKCKENAKGMFHGYEPKLSLSLFETPPNAFRHWTNLFPRETSWTESEDNDEVPCGMLYIFEHTLIYETHVGCFCEESGQMRIQLEGKCDVHYDEVYGQNLDLHLDTQFTFSRVWFGRSSEDQCRDEISPFLNPDDFDYTQDKNGVSLLVPKGLSPTAPKKRRGKRG